jgi:branched-chain amino acid transport system substrate-binding protein
MVPLPFCARRQLAPLVVAFSLMGTLCSQTCLSDTPAKSTASNGRSPIKIGFIVSLTGVAGEGGEEMVNGIRMFLDQNHNQIAGRPVELIVENDSGDPATALAKLRKLVEDDKVQVLDGIVGSHIGYKIAPFVDKYQVPMLFCITSGDDLTKRQRHEWVIRTSWSASQATHVLGDWAYKHMGFRKAITFGLDYTLGWEFVGGFQKTFEDEGGKVVQKVWGARGFLDYSEPIKEMRKDANCVFDGAALKSAEVFPKQYAQLGPHLPMISTGAGFDEYVLRHLGDESVGVVSASNYSPDLDTPENKRFVAAYRTKFKEEPSHFAESTYTSGMWIKKASEAINGNVEDKKKFLAALKQVELPDAPRGPLILDSFGNPIENIYIRQVVKENGHLKNKTIHTYPKVSQFWTYDPQTFLKQPPYTRDYPPCRYCTEK